MTGKIGCFVSLSINYSEAFIGELALCLSSLKHFIYVTLQHHFCLINKQKKLSLLLLHGYQLMYLSQWETKLCYFLTFRTLSYFLPGVQGYQ